MTPMIQSAFKRISCFFYRIVCLYAFLWISTAEASERKTLEEIAHHLVPTGLYSYLNDRLTYDSVGKIISPLVEPLFTKLTSAQSPLTQEEKNGLQAFYQALQHAKKHPRAFDKKKMNSDLISPELLVHGQQLLGRLMDDKSQFLTVTEKMGIAALQLSLEKSLKRKVSSENCAH